MDADLPVKDSKKSLIIVEVILLVLVVCVFIGIFFLKVFPRQGNGVAPGANPSSARIKTSSWGVEGYALHIANQNTLEQLLSDYGFWDFQQWDQYGIRASNLEIIFTGKVQPLYRRVAQDKSVLSSYGVTFDKGKVFLYVQIDPTIDNFDTRSSNIITQYIGRFLYSIYPPAKKTTLSEDAFLKSFYNGPDLFSIYKEVK